MDQLEHSVGGKFRESVASFWVGGAALGVLELGRRFLPVEGERYEWAQYLLLGTLFPAVLLVMSLTRSSRRWVLSATRGVQLVLGGFGLAVALSFAVRHAGPAVWLASGLCWLVLAGLHAWRPKLPVGDGSTVTVDRTLWVSVFVLIFISWSVTARLCYWVPFDRWLAGSRWNSAVFVGSLVMASAVLGGWNAARTESRPGRWHWVDLCALLIFGLASLRIDSLGGPDRFPDTVGMGRIALFHWGPIVGPAELVRQGGWPLWDVPCQYGFLNTLLIAALPFRTVWQSFYVLNALLTFLSAVILYAILRAIRGGPIWRLFCVVEVAAAVYLIVGDLRLSTGPSIMPAIGAYRFFWCYALVGFLALRSLYGGDALARPVALLYGNGLWLLGSLWSSESATYCAAIWLPAQLWLVLSRTFATATWQARLRSLAWLLLPSAFLGTTLAFVNIPYLAILGHAADWRGFFDYSFSNIKAQGTSIDRSGAVCFAVLMLSGLATALVRLLERRSTATAVAILTGAWGAVWAACGYFVARSDQGLLLNLAPIFCLAIAATFFVIDRWDFPARAHLCLGAVFLPFLVLVPTFGLSSQNHLTDWAGSAKKGYVRSVDYLLPVMGRELATLLNQSGVGRDDAICYIDDSPMLKTIGVRWSEGHRTWSNQTWLPIIPFQLLHPLSEERRRVYLERFVDRVRVGGWLVEPKTLPVPSSYFDWLRQEIAATHAPTEVFESRRWRVTRYEPRIVADGGGGGGGGGGNRRARR